MYMMNQKLLDFDFAPLRSVHNKGIEYVIIIIVNYPLLFRFPFHWIIDH